MFYQAEIDQLKKLCRTDDDGGGAFAIDMLPAVPKLSARQRFERDLGTTW